MDSKDANEHILCALDTMCRRSGCTARRKNVTSSRGSKKGDLEIRDINLAGKRDLVIDVAIVHDFSGNCLRDAQRNGQLRYDDPDLLLTHVASTIVQKYREDYSASNVNKAFLPALFFYIRPHPPGILAPLLYLRPPPDSQVLRNHRGGALQ